MSTILSALLFAASLSSTSVDEFFTFPSWMPTSVSSANTPGSDPSIGGGWYVKEYTNRVDHIGWDVTCSTCDDFYLENYQILNINNKWDVLELGSIILTKTIAGISASSYRGIDPRYIQGPRTDNVVSSDGQITYIDSNQVTRTFSTSYTATKRNRYTPVETGRWTPRAARLTPEVHAGVLSSFAGYFERLYYSNEGQSNVWNTSIFGPTNNKKKFWFNPTGYDTEFSYNPSNRTINTRRLLEYENISGLADTFINIIANFGFTTFADVRPGWISVNETLAWGNLWWASTEESAFTSEDIVPSFSWIHNPTALSAWGTCCQIFDCTEYDYIWHPRYYETDVRYTPTSMLMKSLDFGMTPYGYDDCKPTKINQTITQIIETNYPHADGWAITNQTRRLNSDALCNINQVMGLMDRTYHVPDVVYPSTGTNYEYRNALSYEGHVPVRVVRDTDDQWSIYPTTSISWGGSTPSDLQYGSSIASSPSALHYRVSRTGTSCGFSHYFTGAGGMTAEGMEEQCLWFHQLPDGDYDFLFVGGSSLYYYIYSQGTKVAEGFGRSPTISDTNDVGIVMSYTRNYSHKRTIGSVNLGVTQPGRQGVYRVDSSKYGSVIGTHRISDDAYSTSLGTIVYNSLKSYCSYKSNVDNYTAHADLVDAMINQQTVCSQKFETDYGKNPDAWAQIIPINGNDALRVRDSYSFTKGTIHYVTSGWTTMSTVSYVGGIATVTSVVSMPTDGEEIVYDYVELCIPSIDWVYTSDPVDQEETPPLAMDAKIGVITQVDWDWKTLKRGTD